MYEFVYDEQDLPGPYIRFKNYIKYQTKWDCKYRSVNSISFFVLMKEIIVSTYKFLKKKVTQKSIPKR